MEAVWLWTRLTEIVFTKLASQLTAEKLVELAVIPVIFIVQTLVSYLVSIAVGKAFGFNKRASNFVTAMGVSLLVWMADGSANCALLGLRKFKLPTDLTRHFFVANT
jgi:steroid 5-alpha reductase family enzyme